MNDYSNSTQYRYREYTTKPEGHHRYLHPVVLDLLSRHVKSGARVLDAGCGNGGLAEKLVDSYQVFGCDLSESGVAAARQTCPKARFEVASVYDDFVECFGHTFDAAVSLEVLEHLYDPHTLIARLHAAIAPGGTLIVSTPYHGYLKNLVMAVTGKLDTHFGPLQTGGHIKFWSRHTLSRLLERNGFDVIEFAGCGRSPLLWKSMVLVGRLRNSM